jgi:pimeloyl-ACP methyl ester carboxylesterase
MLGRWRLGCCVLLMTLTAQTPPPRAMLQDAGAAGWIAVRTANVDGAKLQYLTAGHGPAIILLHGYAETSRMWRPLIPRLASTFTVIAPDLPGIGDSDIPNDGLDMTHAASRVHALVKGLGIRNAAVAGHDIGLMVAYAYAAQFPSEVDKLVLMDAFLPGVNGWEAIYNNPTIWHFRFSGPTPESLVRGVNAFTSSTSGTTCGGQDALHSRSRPRGVTPPPTAGRDGCGPVGRTSYRFSKPPGISHNSRGRN